MLGDYVFQARIRLIIGSLSFNADYSSKIPSLVGIFCYQKKTICAVLFSSSTVALFHY